MEEEGGLGTPSGRAAFHGSFIHFIASLEGRGGVDEKSCHPATDSHGSLTPSCTPL